jgi:hypothetical protein
VHLSHGPLTQTLDTASTSPFSMSIIAWYNNIVHEMKPVLSGYRLALVYSISNTSGEDPLPSFPDMQSAHAKLRGVLRDWQKGLYKSPGLYRTHDAGILAYILNHKYDKSELQFGAKILQGEDKHRVANLRVVAEELGYVVSLADLWYYVTDAVDAYDYETDRFWRRWRSGLDAENEDMAMMGERICATLKVDHLVDLAGNVLLTEAKPGLPIDENDLIPSDSFEDAKPDEKEYEEWDNVSHFNSCVFVARINAVSQF